MSRAAILGKSRPLLALVLLLAFLGACGNSSVPEPDPDAVTLVTTRGDDTYVVSGSNASEIFSSIEARGPSDDSGVKGSGLTEARWSYTWRGETRNGYCLIDTMTITLDLTVTLPRHESVATLSDEVRTRWNDLVDEIATHEERHVTIYEDGAAEMKGLMSDIGALDDCSLLEEEIRRIWSDEQGVINARQDQFHAEEDERLAAQRAPLEADLDASRDALAQLTSDVKEADATVSYLKSQVDTIEQELNALQGQLRQIENQYPEGAPPDVVADYEEIRSQYNSKIDPYNTLVSQYNTALDQRTGLLASYNEALDETNAIIEELNWLR